ncbi:hypothetical protein PPBDW_II1124 [Photobacterium kishitanii]|nr:hypothetical protein PPBDW_II1124 [Photobacterium kishitanii]
MAEEAGIEPTKAYTAHIGFEDREGHQTSSHSEILVHNSVTVIVII